MAAKKPRCPMSAVRRAKQFQPFDALKGFKEAIAAKERFTEPKIFLTDSRVEEINQILLELSRGQMVILTFYDGSQQRYENLTGQITEIDPTMKCMKINNQEISYEDIYDIGTL